MEREVRILDKTEEIMKIFKSIPYRERKVILKFLEELIDVDKWIDGYGEKK